MKIDHKEEDRFKNRRKMAWISFYFIVVVGGGMMLYGISDDQAAARVDQISFLIGTVFGVLTTIVVSYFTSSTITQVNDLRFKKDEITVKQEYSEAVLAPPDAK